MFRGKPGGAGSRQKSAGSRPGPWRDSRLGEGCHSAATGRELRSTSSWPRSSAPGDHLPGLALRSGFCWPEEGRVACMHAKSLQSCPTLCDPMDCSLLASSVHGISQARILEWVAVSYSRHSSQPRDRTYISYVSCLLKWILCHLESPLTTEDDLTMSPG